MATRAAGHCVRRWRRPARLTRVVRPRCSILPHPGLVVAPALFFCVACYTFESAAIGSVRPGMELRARLSEGGVTIVADLTGDRRSTVDGTLVRLDAETAVLSVWRTDVISSNFEPGRLELPLETRDIVDVQVKRLSYLRTGALVSGVAAGLYLLLRTVWGGAGGLLSGDGGVGEI